MQTDRVVLRQLLNLTSTEIAIEDVWYGRAPRSLLVWQAEIAVAGPLTSKHQALDYLVLGQ